MRKNKLKIALIMLSCMANSAFAADGHVTFYCDKTTPYPKIDFDYDYLTWHWNMSLFIRPSPENVDIQASLAKRTSIIFQVCEMKVCQNPDAIVNFHTTYNSYTGYVSTHLADHDEKIFFTANFDEDHPNPCNKPTTPPKENNEFKDIDKELEEMERN